MKNIDDLHVAIAQPRTVRLVKVGGLGSRELVSPNRSNFAFQGPLAVAGHFTRAVPELEQKGHLSVLNFLYEDVRDPTYRDGVLRYARRKEEIWMDMAKDFPLDPYGYYLAHPEAAAEIEALHIEALNYHRYISQKYIEVYFQGATNERIRRSLEGVDFLGITADFTFEASSVADLIKRAKEVNKHMVVGVGGADATARPEFYLANGADRVIQREAEGLTREQILAVIQNEDGPRIINGRASYDVDNLPLYPYHLLDKETFVRSHDDPDAQGRFASIQTSRACPENCHFCPSRFLSGKYRYQSLRAVEQQLDHLVRHGFDHTSFDENNFLARQESPGGRDEIMAIMQMLKDRQLKWEWPNGLQIKHLQKKDGRGPDTKLIEAIYGDGCYSAMIPIERTTAEERKALPKLLPRDEELDILRAIGSTGVQLKYCLIIGGVGEKVEKILETWDNAVEIRETLCQKHPKQARAYIHCATPLAGSLDYRELLHNGDILFSAEEFPELYTYTQNVIRGRHIEDPDTVPILRRVIEESLNKETSLDANNFAPKEKK